MTYTGANFLARWQHQFAPSSDITLQVYWNHLGQSGPQLQDVEDTVDIDFVHQVSLGRNHVVYGGGARVTPDRFTQVASMTSFSPAHFTYELYSAFAQDEIQLAKHLALTLGSKFEHNSYPGLEIQPTARRIWNQPARQSAWLAVTHAVRSPSRLDRDFSLFLLRGSYSYLHLDLATRAGLTDLSAQRTYLGSSPQHIVTAISEFTLPHGVQFDQV